MSKATVSREPKHTVLRDNKGPMRFRQFKLSPKALIKWQWEDAPHDIRELSVFHPGTPEYVTVVPMNMRFSHMPPGVQEVVELEDGYVVFE